MAEVIPRWVGGTLTVLALLVLAAGAARAQSQATTPAAALRDGIAAMTTRGIGAQKAFQGSQDPASTLPDLLAGGERRQPRAGRRVDQERQAVGLCRRRGVPGGPIKNTANFVCASDLKIPANASARLPGPPP